MVETLATDPSLVLQVTLRPERALPEESFGVAVSWTVPGGIRLAVLGLTLTEATGVDGWSHPSPRRRQRRPGGGQR